MSEQDPEKSSPSGTRRLIYAVGALIFCVACARLVALRHQPTTQGFHQIDPNFTPKWLAEVETNHLVKQNNGSKREGLIIVQVPSGALQLGKEYQTIIYPALVAGIAEHKGRLPSVLTGNYPGPLGAYLAKTQWMGGVHERLDGTMMAYNTYAADPLNKPHDVWASYDYHLVSDKHDLGWYDPKKIIRIDGWDDGHVTYDPLVTMYTYNVVTPLTNRVFDAPPGSAGIPPAARKQGA